MKKKSILIVILWVACLSAFSQLEISSFNATGGGYSTTFLTDYQCLGINPANLGWTWDDHRFNIGFLETGMSIYSEPLTKKQVLGDLFSNEDHLSMADRQQAAKDFSNSLLWAQAGITWVGFSYQNEKIGGFAFSIRDRALWNTVLNDKAADFLFLGYNDPYFDSLAVTHGDTVGYSTNPKWASEVYNGSYLHFLWYREYNFGYGRIIVDKEDFKMYGGIGIKYLAGYGSYQYIQEGSDLRAYTALSPLFDVDYDAPTPSQVSGNGLKRVGDGIGFDIGFTFLIKNKLKLALALNDIGFINWNGNVYKGNNTSVWKIETSGMHNYNVFEQGELITTDNAPNDPNLWDGLESKKVNLPMHFRGGASFRFNPKIEIGGDIYVPIEKKVPGTYEKIIGGIGCHYDPAKWVQLSIGVVSGGKIGTNLPFGVSFFPVRNENSTWQLGFALRDMISLFKKNDATVSAAFGFIRVSFGKNPNKSKLPPQEEEIPVETPREG